MSKSALTPRRDNERGSSLLVAILILGALALLGSSLVLSSVEDRTVTRYVRHSMEALGAAETGVAYAQRMIQDLNAPMEDYDADGRPDFELSDSLSWGGTFNIIAEASDIKDIDISAYRSNGFTVVSEGEFQGAVRRVRAQMVHESFLKYARFVARTSLSYSCTAVLTGAVHTGGDLNIPCGCGGDDDVTFLEDVSVVGSIPNVGCGLFMRGYVDGADPIDLGNSVDWDEVADMARGIAPENDCEGVGRVGIYINLPGTDPLGLLPSRVLDFSLFNFHDTSIPPDTIISYNGNPVINTLTGNPMNKNDFNGLIFFNSMAGGGFQNGARVKGTLDGRSGRNLTVFTSYYLYIMDDVVTGHTGFDPVTGDPNGTGNPVNVGLVARYYVYIDDDTPRVLNIDAALMSVLNAWRIWDDELGGSGAIASHPVAGPGPLDLDRDGISGESPVNHDPAPGNGWDEMNIDADTWVLNINGPIITDHGGSAWPWNDGGVLANADGPTRRYNYDLDITQFPPPCFPVPLNLWKNVNWTEIFETDSTLASYLPN
jgi:hypothetical protein